MPPSPPELPEPCPEIEPCPWCGRQSASTMSCGNRLAVKCYDSRESVDANCHAQGPYRATRFEAIAAWNRVAKDAAEVQRLRAWLERIGREDTPTRQRGFGDLVDAALRGDPAS